MIGAFVLAMFVTTAAEEAKAPAAKPAKEPKVCRSQIDTGTRLGKRQVCRTAAEWRAIEDATSKDLESRTRSGS